MSIPPLVCSTPPPPEKCDDDRDTEDFDIQYNLSQDDEDDGHDYNYGTYSDYIYSSSTSSNIQQDIWSSNISKKTDEKLYSDLLEERNDNISDLPKSDSSSINKVGFEDIVIEDLNLKLEDQNDEASLEQITNKFETFEDHCDKDLTTQNTIVDDKSNNDQHALTQDINDITLVIEGKNDDSSIEEAVVGEYTQEGFNIAIKESEANEKEIVNKTIDDSSPNLTEATEENDQVIDQKGVIGSENKLGDMSDDEFGEFDDFQFISSENNPTTITYCDNPWKTEDSKNPDFGNFTANFDEDTVNLCKSNEHFDEKETNESNKLDTLIDEADDFGDFDDFKSSSNDNQETVNNEPSQNVPVLSLYSPENESQIIDSINSVLSSIFTSDISEEESGCDGKIDTLLNETWGHLVDTDVRQSYIVNWNNSLGQKSLLKALCIDSRNILFGPKWNSSMPKFAANLTVAPLQPQKPVTPTNTRNADEQHVDKTTNKESSTWTDPFTADGQESCNTENENTATIKRPTNLDVFSNVISPEGGHIYSSTLSVQPIRQINLPDTHIFTPTDSETPRSKTIHYNQGSAMLMPQSSEDSRQLDEVTSKSEVSVQNSENDEDYWEFQDFKGNSSTNVPNSVNEITKTSTVTTNTSIQIMSSYETQILQPIKVEPIAPALNWPDPGEVKETFDDFSEFISNTSWNKENTNIPQPDSRLESKLEGGTEILEDDFETFQSAPTFKSTTMPSDNTFQATASFNHQNFNDFPQSFIDTSDISHVAKSNTEDIVVSKQTLVQNISPITRNITSTGDNFTPIKDINEKTSPVLSASIQNINATIMQPSIANTSASQRNQQKSGQILQPLSLESYSQINWPSPGIDLQDLSRFNPVESLQSLKTDLSTGGSSKLGSPAHKDTATARNEISDDDIWGDFVSSKPKQPQMQSKKVVFADDEEWTDFVSSPSVKPQNGLNTISLNVHTNLNMQKSLGLNKFHTKSNQLTMDIPTLKYVTPKTSSRGYNDKHFQNL